MTIFEVYRKEPKYKTVSIPVPPTETKYRIIHNPPERHSVFDGYEITSVCYFANEDYAVKYCLQHPNHYYKTVDVKE